MLLTFFQQIGDQPKVLGSDAMVPVGRIVARPRVIDLGVTLGRVGAGSRKKKHREMSRTRICSDYTMTTHQSRDFERSKRYEVHFNDDGYQGRF
jgi:hypothetical protein